VSVVGFREIDAALQKNEKPTLEYGPKPFQIFRPTLVDTQENDEPRRRCLGEERGYPEKGSGR
jgi:hypothetical protein